MNTHFKIEYQAEIRRFSCQPDFAILETTTKTLCRLPWNSKLVFKYLDEDKDLCTITSTIELACAVSHLPSPLKLSLIVLPEHQAEPIFPSTTALVEGAQISRQQVIERKLAHIKELLQKPDVPIHRAENLNFRRERLESVLESLRTGEQPSNPKPGFSPEMAAIQATIDAKRTQLHEARQKGATKPQIEALVQELVDARLAKKSARRGEFQTKNPQLASVNQEIALLKDIVATKRQTLQQARRSGVPQSQLEILFKDLEESRNDLIAKKATKRQHVQQWRHQNEQAQRVDPEHPEPEHAEPETSLQANLIAKRTALQEAKKSGTPRPQLVALRAELIIARKALNAEKQAVNQQDRSNASPLQADLIAKRAAFQQAKQNGAPQSQINPLKADFVAAKRAIQEAKKDPALQSEIETVKAALQSDPQIAALRAVVVAKRSAFQEAQKKGAPKPQLNSLKADLVAARLALNVQRATVIRQN